jgi:hypothetical protein
MPQPVYPASHKSPDDLSEILGQKALPAVTLWNRLEARPRAERFDRALKAEVRDPLWMLARQWQMGEFRGDDAGSPVFAKVHVAAEALSKYRAADGPVERFDDGTPLEARVERRPVPLRLAGHAASLDLRLLMGRQWLKMLAALGDFSGAFIQRYPIVRPDPAVPADAPVCAHPEAWSVFAAVAGRRMDGAKLHQYLASDPAHHAWDGIPGLDAHAAAVDALAARWMEWFRRLVHQPGSAQGDAWEADRLEYRFACSAPHAQGHGHGERVLVADEYFHGRLDWYNLDVDPGVPRLGNPVKPPPYAGETRTMLPKPLVFQGMPNTRWWAFEDRKTSFGDVKPDTTDLAKLLLVEFGLVYANDWFLVPWTVTPGSLVQVRGLAVTNVFGERFWIDPAGSGEADDWQRWAMFMPALRGDPHLPADRSLVLLPTVPKVQEGRPLDEVLLVRDEVSNLVWGVEKTVPLPTGAAKPGGEAAREMRGFQERDLARRLAAAPPAAPPPVPAAAAAARIRYDVMSAVPEHWIPFLPVHVPGDVREIQLQRGALPRVLDGDPAPAAKVRPRTALLREGLDREPAAAYYLHEEEVPRAGVRVTQSYQRTRWRDGRVWIWLGVRKQTGRGEGSSGLAFDRIVDVPGGA